jgi:hypothetical protein
VESFIENNDHHIIDIILIIRTVAAKELLAFEVSAVKKRRVLGLKIIVLIIG